MSECSQRITRRKFLKTTAAGIALGLAGTHSFSFAKEEIDLAVISGDPVAATKKALEVLGGISRFVKKGQRVVLKPNMSFTRTPEFGAPCDHQAVACGGLRHLACRLLPSFPSLPGCVPGPIWVPQARISSPAGLPTEERGALRAPPRISPTGDPSPESHAGSPYGGR